MAAKPGPLLILGGVAALLMLGKKKTAEVEPEAPELDANTICSGFAYEYKPGFILNLALMKTLYDSEITSTGIELKKEVTGFGVGIQYKFQ